MPRPLRMLVSDEKTAYHVISRTALLGLPFDDADNDMFVKILKRYTSIYFSDVLGFCCMGNHFHLVLQMYPEDHCTNQEIKNALKYIMEMIYALMMNKFHTSVNGGQTYQSLYGK